MQRKHLISFVTLLICVFITTNLFAQNSGKIVGTVIDKETRTPLPGANVIIEGTSLGAATDLEGRFIIMRIPPGRYTLRVIFIGYQKTTLQNVEVLTDLTTTANFELTTEILAGEEVTIIAEAPIIRKDLTSA